MTDLQQKLFAEMLDPSLYATAAKYGSEYLEKARERNIYPEETALEALANFNEDLPSGIGKGEEILEQLRKYGAPATVSQVGGRYFGFVNGGIVPAGLTAKVLGSFWDQNTAMHVISPLASKLETVVEQWLKSIFNLPPETVTGYLSGTSSANLCGLAAGRYRLLKNLGWDVNEKGLSGAPPLKIVASAEAHATVIKALTILGFGRENIIFIDTDEQGRIKMDKLPEPDSSTLLILAAGNVNSGSFDDFSAICSKAKNAGAWVHIDGAFGLWAAAVESLKHLTSGMEQASSWAVDGHKTLNTPYDCGIILCAEREALTNALHMAGGYLVLSDGRDGMFFTPEMSRRARIIELWATLKFLGTDGIDQMIRAMHERAKQFAKELTAISGFTLLNEVVFSQVVVACADDELTDKVIRHVQEERVCWVGGSLWKGRKVIRISICSWATTENDVSVSVQSFQRALNKALSEALAPKSK